MPVEPSGRISETRIIKREEGAVSQQKKKPAAKKQTAPKEKEQEKPGKIDIKI